MVLVYDLRYDPSEFSGLAQEEVRARLFSTAKELASQKMSRLPVKGVSLNKSPAFAPLGVLDAETWEKIGLSQTVVEENLQKLDKVTGLIEAVQTAYSDSEFEKPSSAEEALYDGFVSGQDKAIIAEFAASEPENIFSQSPDLTELWFGFIARNAPQQLSEPQLQEWKEIVRSRLQSKSVSFGRILQAIASDEKYASDDNAQFLLEELHLYMQSLDDYNQ
jgi:exodeoxyribonuclease-1